MKEEICFFITHLICTICKWQAWLALGYIWTMWWQTAGFKALMWPNLGQNIPGLSSPLVFSAQNSRHGITSVAAYPEIVCKWSIIAQDIVGYEQQKRSSNVICFKVNIQIAYLLMLISQYIQLQIRTWINFTWNTKFLKTSHHIYITCVCWCWEFNADIYAYTI